MKNTELHPTVRKTIEQAAKRRAEIRKLRERGFTLQAIGDKYGIGRERVRQLLSRED